MGTVEDIAMMALYLSSDAASYITGETIVVDGGSWLYKQRIVSRYTIITMKSHQIREVLEDLQKKRTPRSKM
jgi:hypothetical protein